MMRDMIKTIGTIKMLLRLGLVLLMMVIGGEMNCAWGQTGTNRSGLFYFVNCGSGKDNPVDPKIADISDPDDYFYLVPADNPQQGNKRDAWYSYNYDAANGDPEKPYLTTYKTKKDAAAVPTDVTNRPHNSVWIVKFASTDSGTDYYYLIHAATGKYVVYEPPYSAKNNRKSVHLLTTDSPGENAKFAITLNSVNYNFRPKSIGTGASTNKYLNAANANYNFYYSNDKTADGVADYFRGLLGLWKNNGSNADGSGSDWKPEATLLDAPTISEVDANNKVTIADANSLPPGYEIRYTTDGLTEPTASTGTVYEGPIDITNEITIKAVVVRYGMVLTELASETREPVPCATPVITFDSTTSMVSIACATDGSTIHYTIDGGIPTAESDVYGDPIPVTGETTVKAIATHTTMATSEVGTLTISQVVTPTIQNDGSNAISITSATPDATIYYTIDGSTPTTSSSQYTTPLRENVSGVTIKAIAVKENMITSGVGDGSVTLQCEAPVIVRSSNTSFTVTCPFPASGVTIYYTTDGGTPNISSSSTTSGTTVSCTLPATIKAIAVATNYNNSEVATITLNVGMGGEGTAENPYTIEYQNDVTEFNEKANTTEGASKHYKVIAEGSLDFSGVNNITQEFSGSFDGGNCILMGLSNPLFNTVNGGVVKNVTLQGVGISSSADNVGAIAGVAKGYSRIYNCGILPNDATFPEGTHPTVSTSGACAGGIVGYLQDDSRVINCYSYADVSATTYAAGIVGYNNYASTAEVETIDGVDKYTKLRTAVVNCMFYGNITGGTNQYGVYGGFLITNAAATGISSYNYFRSGSNFTAANGHKNTNNGGNVVGNPTAYNCSFPADERYLTQVEFHRSLLNSNRELCGWWVGAPSAPSEMTTEQVQAIPKDASLMYKWVVDPGLAPYPILKPFGKYASVINNPGIQTGKTLSVTVKSGKSAGDKTFDLPITDMDPQNHDYGYYKVQLPYYNTVFGKPNDADWATKYAGNYTDQVVTGWKVTAVNNDGENNFVDDWQYGYNFADRKCTDKDLYETSGRVFAQGGYYYVPDGVTAITIEAYWGKAIYVRNDGDSYDRVNITAGTTGSAFEPAGTRGDLGNGQTVYTTTIRDVIDNITEDKSVYDHAIVLVGNVQESNGDNAVTVNSGDTRGFTIMSVDFDFDEEPDYCLEWQLGTGTKRNTISPVRFDFLPVIELGIAYKLHNSTNFFSLGCFRSKGHFEVTETAFIRFGQFEFETKTRNEGPIILNGGIFDQYTRGTMGNDNTNNIQHITYVILGGHIVMPSFTPGAHVNGNANYATRHCAVNALGGDFTSFYLTGGYNENVNPYADNPHCYIDGGRFGTIAAAYKEGIAGNVTWRINHALIDEFYGGGMMSDDNKIVKGNIDVVINNSIVGKYCGGPKFGNMVSGKTVTTSATNTTFTEYYGAGNGGTNYVQYANDDKTDGPRTATQWQNLLNGKYSPKTFISTAKGYHANYDYEEINPSTGTTTSGSIDRIYYYSAQFATTNTGTITNTLDGCTIEQSFYGGGFLGGVNGNVTSTLNNCTVTGSVFGAGYSASAGTVTIYNTDKTPPVANIYTGIVKPQEGGTSTEYYWTHNNSGSTGSPVMAAEEGVDHDYFYTEISLDNLGAVDGNVTLTLDGNTTVGGSVYGGGDASAVTGAGHNVTVTLKGNTIVNGSVFGGGNNGKVEGSSIVNVEE